MRNALSKVLISSFFSLEMVRDVWPTIHPHKKIGLCLARLPPGTVLVDLYLFIMYGTVGYLHE